MPGAIKEGSVPESPKLPTWALRQDSEAPEGVILMRANGNQGQLYFDVGRIFGGFEYAKQIVETMNAAVAAEEKKK